MAVNSKRDLPYFSFDGAAGESTGRRGDIHVPPYELTAALESILSGEPVYWRNCSDSMELLRAVFELLPPEVRRRVTFATECSAWPRQSPLVIASTYDVRLPDKHCSEREILDFHATANTE